LATSIVQDWLASWEIKVAVDDFDTASVDILFGCRAGVDAMAKVPAKGTPLGMCTVEKIGFGVACHRSRGGNGGGDGGRRGEVNHWLYGLYGGRV